MELEFDKEIDAILRRANSASGSKAPSSPHLDADVIAAFAENALPKAARSQYTLHLADCDRCRKYLSQAISMNEQAVEPSAVAVPITAPVADVSVPWYQAIFRTPSLAVAMGALILVFSGVLGFLVLRGDRNSGNTFVSQVGSEQEAVAGGPYAPEISDIAANSNASAAATPGQSTGTTNTMASAPTGMANSLANTATRAETGVLEKEVSPASPAPVQEKSFSARQMNDLPKVTAAPPPPPTAGATMDGVAADQAKRDAETRQAERSDLSLSKRKEMDASRSRDIPPAASKSGPGRSGPVQMQNTQNARNATQMSVTRSAGGRKFNNRDGAWYDTAYKGEATTNVRRSSDEFKKLDSGLQSIANQIDGVVVVVWKTRAYRIQ